MKPPFVICVIDDDPIAQFTVSRVIEKNNLARKVIAFSDGEEALAFLNSNRTNNAELPDAILLDINMPIMDGWEFLEEYVKVKPQLPKKIILYMISSSVDPVDIERAKKISEVSDYLIKPITQDKLREIVHVLEAASNNMN